MTIFVLSHRCGHCVHRQAVMSAGEYEKVKRSCVGKPCPVCGVRPRSEDDLQVGTSRQDLSAIEDGSLPWGRTVQPTAHFAGFVGADAAHPFERGVFATSLRAQMSRRAAANRKRDYELLSLAFAAMSGFGLGLEAFENGDYARAVVWMERAAEALKDPSEIAGACLYLGLARSEQGKPRLAEAAFRRATDLADADPRIRSVVAGQLGSVCMKLGDIAGARTALESAISFGFPESAATAALNLGILEDEAGNRTKAGSLWDYAYRTAVEDEVRSLAVYNLGWHWEQAGDLAKARRFYKLAAKASSARVATRAEERLRILPRRGWWRR
jgi:tetratricopeptide (TPR) repeat protein